MTFDEVHIAKRAAAKTAVSLIRNEMIIGLGTGSTARIAIDMLGDLVRKGLKVRGVPSSSETEKQAINNEIPLLNEFEYIDISIDGADEVDDSGNLIKGGGGALTREKIVASASHYQIIIIDESKRVKKLGQFPLPVEVLPFGLKHTLKHLQQLGSKVQLRLRENLAPFITDNSHYIADCYFQSIDNAIELSNKINNIPGVIENGLFVGMTHLVIIGQKNGEIQKIEFK